MKCPYCGSTKEPKDNKCVRCFAQLKEDKKDKIKKGEKIDG